MKFRDPKTGEVFEDIDRAYSKYCCGRDCDTDCTLNVFKECGNWATNHPADAARLMGLEVVEEDIDLINRISKTPLTESEVYTFSMRLCDNEVDRDWDWFSTQALEKMSEMFIGKRGILGHLCSARIYRTELVRDAEKTTTAGDEYCCLKGWAYMLRNEQGKDVIAEIEAGIKKEVSVGCAVERSVCSICGADIGTCPHVKGKTYDGWLCFAELRNPTDVYEWSFVTTPAKKKEEPMEKMDKPRIAWDKIGPETAIWCKTEEEAKALLLAADKAGYRWFNGELLTKRTSWEEDRENTVYMNFDGTGVTFGDRKTIGRNIIPYTDLLLADKPRICEVLGVEVGERFDTECYKNAYIDSCGVVRTNTGSLMDSDRVCELINHPDRIIRKPRFTEEEVEDTKNIMRFFQTAYSIERYKDSTLGVRSREQFLTNITNSLFPSLRPGQAVKLEDIVGDGL